MKRTYEVRDRADKRAIREFLKREGQFLLPMLELVEQTEVAIDEVIQVMGRATIEAVLEMSAEGVAGVKQAGWSYPELVDTFKRWISTRRCQDVGERTEVRA